MLLLIGFLVREFSCFEQTYSDSLFPDRVAIFTIIENGYPYLRLLEAAEPMRVHLVPCLVPLGIGVNWTFEEPRGNFKSCEIGPGGTREIRL